MMELVTFFFTDGWHFAGMCFVICLVGSFATGFASALPRK
jgi:hypothetical protein